jgi:hypothetical protein
MGSIHDSLNVVAVVFHVDNGLGEKVELRSDFIVVDNPVPGYAFGLILPHAQNTQVALNDFLLNVGPHLPYSGPAQASEEFSSAALSDSTDNDEAFQMLDSIFSILKRFGGSQHDELRSPETIKSEPTSLNKTFNSLIAAALVLMKNILPPPLTTDPQQTSQKFLNKRTVLKLEDFGFNETHPAPKHLQLTFMQGAQKINDTWEVFGPPNLNDYPPIPIETYPGVNAYNSGNFNADRNLTPEQRREIQKMF